MALTASSVMPTAKRPGSEGANTVNLNVVSASNGMNPDLVTAALNMDNEGSESRVAIVGEEPFGGGIIGTASGSSLLQELIKIIPASKRRMNAFDL